MTELNWIRQNIRFRKKLLYIKNIIYYIKINIVTSMLSFYISGNLLLKKFIKIDLDLKLDFEIESANKVVQKITKLIYCEEIINNLHDVKTIKIAINKFCMNVYDSTSPKQNFK